MSDLDEKLHRLQATLLIQSAETSSLMYLYAALRKSLAETYPDLPTVSEDFVLLRKKMLQTQLESLETTQPELAARLQELIDQSSTILPINYDEE